MAKDHTSWGKENGSALIVANQANQLAIKCEDVTDKRIKGGPLLNFIVSRPV